MASTAPGLYRRGDTWWIRYSVNGKQVRRSAETTNRKTAEALLGKIKAEIHEGRHFPEKRRASMSVEQLAAAWRARSSEKRSLRDDEQRFKRIVEFFGPDRPIATIDTSDVVEFRSALLAETTRRGIMAPATVNRHLTLLGSALRYASDSLKQRTLDPMRGIDQLDELNERDRIATPEEYEALLAGAAPQLRLAIVIGYWTGMRLGEVIGLRWDQVDLKAGVARLKAADTKTKEARIVPLSKPVIEALKMETRPLDGGAIFTVEATDKVTGEVTREPMKATSMSPLFSRLVKKLGIKDLRYHDLRHTALTRLRRAGVDVLTMQRVSGHKTLDMLRRYNTITEADLVAAVAKATE